MDGCAAGDAVDDFVVDADADVAGEIVDEQEGRIGRRFLRGFLEPMAESSAVVTPGRTAADMARRALATIRPQARSFSSCSAVVMDMGVVVRSLLRGLQRKSGSEPPHSKLVAAAAAATAATTAAAGGTAGRGAAASGREDGKLNRGFFAGTLGAGDFLLFVDDDFFKAFAAGIADVFVDGHGDEDLSRRVPRLALGVKVRL